MKTKILAIAICLLIWLTFFTIAFRGGVLNGLEHDERYEEMYGGIDKDELRKYLGEVIHRTPEEWHDLWEQVNAMPTSKEDLIRERGTNEWTVIGPFGGSDAIIAPPSAGERMTGRLRDLAQVSPLDANDSGIRLLSASGGVWRVNVSGSTELLSKELLPQYLGAFTFSPLGADTIWVGSGEPSTACGMGLFRSYDGGASWTHVTMDAFGDPCAFHKILYHPNDPKHYARRHKSGLLSFHKQGTDMDEN